MCCIEAVISRDFQARPPPDTPQNRFAVHRFAPRNNSNRSECRPANVVRIIDTSLRNPV